MATSANNEKVFAPECDKIVRRLEDFPELTEALRDGDLLTARMFCAQLFDLDSRSNSHPDAAPIGWFKAHSAGA